MQTASEAQRISAAVQQAAEKAASVEMTAQLGRIIHARAEYLRCRMTTEQSEQLAAHLLDVGMVLDV